MRFDTFKKGMAIFVKQFPDKGIDMDIFWEYLQDLEDRDFIDAISKIVMTKQEINKATNLIALIRDFAIPEDNTAGEAWGEVLKKISSIGSWGVPTFSSDLIMKSVNCIGWKTVCMSENIAIERAHFFKVYEAMAKRERVDHLTNSDVKKLAHSIINKKEINHKPELNALIKTTLAKT